MTETTSKTITANIGGRSPLNDHGILGDKGETGVIYASWPMALARAELKPAAKAVAALIWSHTEGWEISIAALAEDSGMSRNTVGKAVDELQAARWLVRQPYGKPGKKPAGEVWHRQLTNVPFTEDEVRELSTLVPIGTGAQKLLTPGAQKVSTGGAQKVSTKVVDVLEVDLQAVHAAEEKEESAASLAFLDDPRFHSIYTVALQHVNPSLDPLEAQERAHSIAVERFRDVQMQDEKILEAQRLKQERWDSMPKWVTDDHRKVALEKNIDLPAKVAEIIGRGSQVRVPGALLSTILRDEKPIPVQVGPVHQCD